MLEQPPADGPVRTKRRAYQLIVDDVEQRIRSGELRPGDRLSSERDLVATYDVSRSSVREALRVLESMGLIELASGDRRGAFVRAPSPAPARHSLLLLTQTVALADLIEFRMVADGAANLMAARCRTDADLVLLERNMARMRESMRLGYEEFSRIDLEFHNLIARISGNDVLQLCGDAVRESILESIRQKIALADDQTAIMLQSIGHHRDVFEAIRDHDGIRASRLAREQMFAYYARHLDADEQAVLTDLVLEVGGTVRR